MNSKHMVWQRYTTYLHIRIGTPKPKLLEAMKIIKDAERPYYRKRRLLRRQRKDLIIIVNAKMKTLNRQDLQALTKTLSSPWWKMNGDLLKLKK